MLSSQKTLESMLTPIDLLFVMLSFLPFESILSFLLLNKTFYESITKSKIFWENKIKKHFPHLLHTIHPTTSSLTFYQAFSSAYKIEYRNEMDDKLEKNKGKLFSLAKEGNLSGLKQVITTFNELEMIVNSIKDSHHHSILYWACINRHQAILDYFYQLVCKDNDPSTNRKRLHWAVMCNQSKEAIESFIQNAQSIDVLNEYHETPLCVAAIYGHLDLLNFLLEKNANVNATHPNDFSPLYGASKKGHVDIVNALIARGAKWNASRDDGITPLDIAIRNGYFEVVTLLTIQKWKDYCAQHPSKKKINFKKGIDDVYPAIKALKNESILKKPAHEALTQILNLAFHHEERLTVLTEGLKQVKKTLQPATPQNWNDLADTANKIGEYAWGNRLMGNLLILLGLFFLTTCFFITSLTLGIGAPLSILGGVIGTSVLTAGLTAAASGAAGVVSTCAGGFFFFKENRAAKTVRHLITAGKESKKM